MTNEIIKFEDGELKLDVTVSQNHETVWLNREQIAKLYDRDIKTMVK